MMLAAGEITYRPLDYWTRQGYLKPEDPQPGSGTARVWPRQERDVAALMLRLLKAGFSVHMAHRIARSVIRGARNGRVSLRIADGVVITLQGDPL